MRHAGQCSSTAERARSNTPLAALAALNDPIFVEAARAVPEIHRRVRDAGVVVPLVVPGPTPSGMNRSIEVVAEVLGGERPHACDLLPALEQLLARLGAAPADLATILVGTGPGSYTGLRVGVATALGHGGGRR